MLNIHKQGMQLAQLKSYCDSWGSPLCDDPTNLREKNLPADKSIIWDGICLGEVKLTQIYAELEQYKNRFDSSFLKEE